MIKAIIDFLVEFFNISKKMATLYVVIPYVFTMTTTLVVFGGKAAVFAAKWDKAYLDIQATKITLDNIKTEIIANAHQSAVRDVAIVGYIEQLSATTASTSVKMLDISRAYAKRPVNLEYINLKEQNIIEEHQNNLPHHQIRKDSVMWKPVIGHRLQQKRK